MLPLDAMRKLKKAYSPYTAISEQDVLAEIGNPTRDTIIDTALEGLKSGDRNVRVLMLRVLAGQSGDKAMRGVLTGLHDDKRRVRSVAIKASWNYRDYPEITERLKAMITDESEKHKIRQLALHTLAGGIGPAVGDLTDTAADALHTLAEMDRYRFEILFRLVRLDLTGQVEDLLKEFVKTGTKDEAVMATKALCGYRVIHLGTLAHDEAAQRHVMQTCDRAAGRMFYWIQRSEYEALRADARF